MTSYQKLENDIRNHCVEEIIKCDIKIALLDSNTTDTEIASIFSSVWTKYLIDFALFKQCVDYLAKEKRIINIYKSLVSYTQILVAENPDKIKQYTIDLIISDDAQKRILGRNLWDNVVVNICDIDLLSLSAENQIRFVVSILQDFLSPQTRLPVAFSFFNSFSQEVRTTLKAVCTIYVMNYYGTSKEIFYNQTYTHSEELQQFKTFLKEIVVWFDVHRNCKEFDANYLYPNIYEIARRTINQHMQEQVKSVEKDRSLFVFDMMSKIQIGRGGGIRAKGGEVRPLTRVSCSVEVPMMLHALTPLEENDMNEYILMDWSKITKDNEK